MRVHPHGGRSSPREPTACRRVGRRRGEIRDTLTGHAKGEVYAVQSSPDGRTV